jgi:hypothetical protein
MVLNQFLNHLLSYDRNDQPVSELTVHLIKHSISRLVLTAKKNPGNGIGSGPDLKTDSKGSILKYNDI